MNEQATTQADVVRAEILTQAHALFCHYGFNKTNIGDIAERCAMSPGNLYRYFRNKQAIGLAVVQKFFELTEAEMDEALHQLDAATEDRIRTLVESEVSHLVREMEVNPKIVELADFLCNDEDGSKVLMRHIAWRKEQLAREIQTGIEQGIFAAGDPQALAHSVHASLKSFYVPMMLAVRPETPPIMVELGQVLDLIFRGLKFRP